MSSSCRSDRDPPPVIAPAFAQDDTDRDAIDLSALVDQARLGFERTGAGYERNATTYRSRIETNGIVTLALPDGRELHASSSFDRPSIAAPPSLARDGSIGIEHLIADGTRIVERFRNTRDGLSQAWELTRSPLDDGSNPFQIHVAITGLPWTGATSRGHHFGPGIRYGAATFVDHDRRRTPLEVVRDSQGLAVVVPRDVLEHAAYPAVVDPILGPENVLDVPASVGDRGGPSVVVPGPAGSFLVAWGGQYAVLARRVLTDGTVVDPGIVVPFDIAFTRPSLAWNPVAGQWLVVARSRSRSMIRGMRIATNGALVDPEPLTLFGAEGGPSLGEPAVGFDGAGWLLATTAPNAVSGASEVAAVRVSAAAKVTTAPVVLATGLSFGGTVRSVACTTATCLVGWHESAGFTVGRVSPTNVALDPGGKNLGAGQEGGTIATDGTDFAVAWSNGASVFAARVAAADGSVLDSPILTVASSSSDASVCWNGTHYAIGYHTGTTTSGRRLPPTGPFTDGASVTLLTMAGSYFAYLGCNGSDHLAMASGSSMRGARVSAAFAPLDAAPGIDIAKSAGEHRAEAAAWNGTTGYVVWNDRGGQNPAQIGVGDLYGIRVSNTGAPIGSATVIATGMYDADAASDGKDFLVVWPDGPTNGAASRSVKAVRVSAASGQILDSPPLVLTTSMWSRSRAGKPHVAFDGKNYVVAWPDARKFTLTTSDIFASRVSPDGQILDPSGFAVSVAPEEQASPAIASDGATGSFIVWNDGRNDYPNYDLYGARISQAGAVLDPAGIPVAVAGHNQFEAVVAWDGINFQVAWLDARRLADERYDDVYTARVSPSGTVLDPLGRVVAEIGSYATLAIAPMGDGRTSLVAFDEAGSDAPGVRGSFIRAKTGDVLDLGGVALASPPSAYVALAPAGSGRALLMYSRVRNEEMSLRTFARFVTTGAADGTACTDAKECSGRFCRDAVCCNDACDAPCRTCGASGACMPVTGADDPDSCTGTSTCDATGACKKKNGSSCEAAADCASGFCADGFCCETACDGACDVCNAPPGKCTMLPKRSPGAPACVPFVCNGASGVCPTRCLSDDDCSDGFGCDRPSGTCRNGPVCTDLVTVRSPTRATSECRPYTCNEGACRSSCSTVADCAFPAKCDENGRCVTADGDASDGCSVTSAPRRANDPLWLAALVLLLVRRRRKR